MDMRLQGKKILIADDEPEIREFLKDELEFEGAVVFEANNGTEAIQIAKAENVEVLISDIRMPGGDGIQLLKDVKAINVHIPVVLFMTGFSDLPIDAAYQLGADAIFAKPFEVSELITKVVSVSGSQDERYSKSCAGTEGKGIQKLFTDLNTARKNGELAIGRGGIFLKDTLGHVGDVCEFAIQFETGDLLLIKGVGTVRWVRSSSVDKAVRGIGIEFDYLPDEIRSEVLKLIKALNPVPYIPTP